MLTKTEFLNDLKHSSADENWIFIFRVVNVAVLDANFVDHVVLVDHNTND